MILIIILISIEGPMLQKHTGTLKYGNPLKFGNLIVDHLFF